MKEVLEQLYQHKKLSKKEAKEILLAIGKGLYNNEQIVSFLTVFRMRPITIEELSGFREAMLELAIKVDLSDYETIDIVGTGGDGKNTFNISTLTSFVVAGTGVKVAKHGNYSVSSTSGSSNVLENLGYNFSNDQEVLKKQLEVSNLCFLHAPKFHPAMKNVAPARKAMGVKTFFNVLGPLVNPSNPQFSLLGTYNLDIARLYHYTLQKDQKNYSVVYSLDGYDEVSLTSRFKIFQKDKEYQIHPKDLKLEPVSPAEIFGGNSVKEATEVFLKIIKGEGTLAQNNVVLTNAAIALQTVNKNLVFEEAFDRAKTSLLGKKSLSCLQTLIQN